MQALRNGMGLDTIKVKREELLAKLHSNLAQHLADYQEAKEGFIVSSIKELEQVLKKARKDQIIPSSVSFDRPVSHADDYETVIEMLTMSVDEEIYLTTDQFRCYVQDKWAWKDRFMLTNTKYMSK